MAAAGHEGEDANLFAAVEAVGMELCPELGIAIPVGKDSLSMRTAWQDRDGVDKSVTAPMSLIITAAAQLKDVRGSLTPQLRGKQGVGEDTVLVLADIRCLFILLVTFYCESRRMVGAAVNHEGRWGGCES